MRSCCIFTASAIGNHKLGSMKSSSELLKIFFFLKKWAFFFWFFFFKNFKKMTIFGSDVQKMTIFGSPKSCSGRHQEVGVAKKTHDLVFFDLLIVRSFGWVFWKSGYFFTFFTWRITQQKGSFLTHDVMFVC
jgi:hypothetical protein